jgi:hypothetical protein
MAFNLSGYILEKPRVGTANSSFTASPDNVIYDQGQFFTAYPASEVNPRTEYMTMVDSPDGSLVTAKFAWTKNEVLQRFDYEGMGQRFKLLPGSVLDVAKNQLGPNANTTARPQVPKPFSTDLSSYPFRISVETTGSGATFTIIFVPDDASFGAEPPAGSVKVSLDTGNTHWSSADLTAFAGKSVRTQRQTFFTLKDSKGRIGVPSNPVLLNPIPRSGQFPVVRFGYSLPLTPVEKPDESSFSVNPAAGTVEWAVDTGRLKFNTGDIAANPGRSIYYEGVLFARALSLTTQNLGTFPLSHLTSVTISGFPPGEPDLIFRVGSKQFAEIVYVTAFDTTGGKKDQVQVLSSGGSAQARFSLSDVLLYAGQPLQVTIGDLPIERGVSMRFFRNPVNLDGSNSTLKDVQSIYEVTDATLANPIIGSPQVFMPAIPIDQSGTITVKIQQGTGSFTNNDLPRLDGVSPPTGPGYYFDFDARTFNFAQRKNAVDVDPILIPLPTGVVNLPDPLIFPGNASFALETSPGSNVYTPLTAETDYLLEPLSGTLTFVDVDGTSKGTSNKGSYTGTTFTDTTVNFITLGVQPEDLIFVTGGPVFTVKSVAATTLTIDVDTGMTTVSPVSYDIQSGQEILADRFFQEAVLSDPSTKVERIRKIGAITNSPRLTVRLDEIHRTRFRFGKPPTNGAFSTSVFILSNPTPFTAPGSLAQGAVEINSDTGEINFSQADITAGLDVYQVLRLQQQIDYKLTAELGFFDFNERALAYDEGLITYKPASTVTDTTPTGTVVSEALTWLVRKEITADHPDPTSTLDFNPTNRRVALQPSPAVFRGGRPQVVGEQCNITPGPPSSITFLSDNILTDALPHGPIVGPTERVYIDYYVFEAFGGEKNTTVLQPPMFVTKLVIKAVSDTGTPLSSFQLSGDWTSMFKADYLMRLEQEEVYLLDTPVYDSVNDITTVNLKAPQVFRSDYTTPKVYLSSGETPITPSIIPPYFIIEAAAYDPAPRGANKIYLLGDRSVSYKTGTAVLFTNGGGTFLDFYGVTGAVYDATKDRTEVTLTTGLARECTMTGGALIKHSIRAILESAATSATTSKTPVLTKPYSVYRKVAGEAGTLLTSPLGYKIDDSGVVKFTGALKPREEVGILYTGYRTVPGGTHLQYSYTYSIAPTAANGILNQVLVMSYNLLSPDTWFYRVETLTNYRGELAQKYEKDSKSSSPSGGPTTSNSATQKLYEQGRPSVFFDEGKYYNEDIVARASLKWYNDSVNVLEDFLQDIDGRLVGHTNGRFLFDGTTGQQVSGYYAATNHIDDIIKFSDAPYEVTFPPFAVTPIGTYIRLWQASAYSRFYRTSRLSVGVTAQANKAGDTMFDLQAMKVSSVHSVRQRPAFALITKDASSGATTLAVDNADGSEEGVRPPFANAMKVYIQDRTGVILHSSATLSAVSTNSLSFTPGAPVAIPAGSTVIQEDAKLYTPFNYGVDADKGVLVRLDVPDGLPSPIDQLFGPIPAATPLQCVTIYSNTDTAPMRAPVFDGKVIDDDGSIALPLQSPIFEAEYPLGGGAGAIHDELAIIATGTGTLRTKTQASYEGTGSLDVTKTTITATGAFPSPVPQVHDLVRILTGLNAGSSYRRITAVGGSTVTVDTPFTSVDTGFSFTVAVSNNVAGTATGSFSGTTLTDPFSNFTTAGVKPGHTVIVTTGLSAGERRQVVTVGATTLTYTPALTIVGAVSYRVDNALGTYNGPELASLNAVIGTNLGILDTNQPPSKPYSERKALEAFFEQCFADLATGTGNANGTTLTDGSASFLSAGINASHFVFIRSGNAKGVFKVANVVSNTQITIGNAFPGVDGAASYRVVSSFGSGFDGLTAAFTELATVDALITSANTLSPLTGTVTVVKPGPVTDLNTYANGLLTSALNTREAAITARAAGTTTSISNVSGILTGSDRLYDKRFVWIDARVNVEKGLLPLQAQAIISRKKAQADIVKNLTKMLAVQ